MNKSKIKLTILFCGSVVLGVALMVAGVWVPVLLPIGGAVLAATLGGALGLWQGIYATQETGKETRKPDSETEIESTPPTRPNTPEPIHDSHDIYNTQNNLFFMYGQRHHRGDDIQIDNLRANKLTMV